MVWLVESVLCILLYVYSNMSSTNIMYVII